MTRFFFTVANVVAIISCLLAFLVLAYGILRSMSGEPAIGDYVAAGALAVVPYCFAGAFHRMIKTPEEPSD